MSEDKVIRVMVFSPAEHAPGLVQALSSAADLKVAGVHGEFKEGLDPGSADVLVIDEDFEEDGFGFLKYLAGRGPVPPAVMVGSGDDGPLRALRAGARDWLPRGENPLETIDSVYRVYEARKEPPKEKEPPQGRGKVLAVCSPRGGSGKTTLAVNLSLAIAAGKTVTLLDLNLERGDVSLFLDVEPKRSIADLASEPSTDPDVVGEYVIPVIKNMGILPSPRVGFSDMISAASVQGWLDALRTLSDWVVVDLPSHLSENALCALERSQVVLLLLNPEMASLKAAAAMLPGLDNHPAQVHLVLNRQSRRWGLKDAEIEKTLGRPLFWTIPEDWRTGMAINRGLPALMDRRRGPLGKSVIGLAKKLEGGRK